MNEENQTTLTKVPQEGGGEIAAALAKAQGAFEPLEKTKTAKVPMKSGGTYSYSYADLADVMRCCRRALSENGLALTQAIVGNELVSSLWHSSGQRLTSAVPMVHAQGQGPQALGSTLTYLRRYGACALLGIVAEEDDDAQIAESERKGGKSTSPAQERRGGKTPPVTSPNGYQDDRATEPQRKRMFALAKEAGYDTVQLKDMLFSMFGDEVMDEQGTEVTTSNLTKGQMEKIYATLEKDAAAAKAKKK